MTKRREFVKKGALGAAGLAIGGLGFSARSYGSIHGSNDRINVAVIGLGWIRSDGLGGMGSQYVKKICSLKDEKNVSVIALCDVDDRCFPESNKTVFNNKCMNYQLWEPW